MPLRAALAQARKLSLAGIELSALGELAPAQLGQTARRELRHLLRSHDLEAAALHAPLRRGLDVADDLDRRLDFLKQALSLSYDLGPRLVVIPFAAIPRDEADPRLLTLRNSLGDLARHGDRVGARLALESGADTAQTLVAFLDSFDAGSLGVCYNPGALLAGGHDPCETLRGLNRLVLHAHARDARHVSAMGRAQEMPLGHGDVDWLQLAATLEEIDYHAWLVLDGEGIGTAQATASVGFLRRVFGAGRG